MYYINFKIPFQKDSELNKVLGLLIFCGPKEAMFTSVRQSIATVLKADYEFTGFGIRNNIRSYLWVKLLE